MTPKNPVARGGMDSPATAAFAQALWREFLFYAVDQLRRHDMEVRVIEEGSSEKLMRFVADGSRLIIDARMSSAHGRLPEWKAHFTELLRTIEALERSDFEVREFDLLPFERHVVHFADGKLILALPLTDSRMSDSTAPAPSHSNTPAIQPSATPRPGNEDPKPPSKGSS